MARVFVFLAILSAETVFAQAQLDTMSLLLDAKLKTMEVGIWSNDDLTQYVNRTKVRVLNSVGFRGFIFVLVERNSKIDGEGYRDTTNLTQTRLALNEELGHCQYVIAYCLENTKYYRLKGFLSNDFREMLSVIKSEYIMKAYVNSKKTFLGQFSIETIDLECLWDALRAKNNAEYPCMRSCVERDRKAWIFK